MARPRLSLVSRMMLFSSLAILTVCAPVMASPITYEFVATSGNPRWTGFTLLHIDADEDGLFSFDELVTGSFKAWTGYYPPFRGTWDGLSGVPGYYPEYMPDGTVQNGSPTPLTEGPGWEWTFYQSAGGQVLMTPSSWWTYSQTAVPIPPSALLLGAGLIPLAWARRKKRLGK